ncbi:phosphatase PAP2 family protein [Chania multitudinisentens]|uniref:phosphatase PAP2 family protein n=1 Tax=Chania multitudinisentens TaxID=1639108 RepID=UPI0003E15264|nr:phosphatase PAP2 family protein [Chania multitudinisentens]
MHKVLLKILDFFGTPLCYLALGVAVAIWHWQFGVGMIFASVLIELICAIVKLLTRFERPAPHPFPRTTLYSHYDASSFPSAHTARIAACTAMLYFCVPDVRLGLVALVLTAGVAYSRVAGRHHYVRDVVAGALLGAGTAYLLNGWIERLWP